MEKYVDHDMCSECGGQCCKENGCIYLPNDFNKLDFHSLKKEINKGYISVSGQPFAGFAGDAWTFLLYLRARNEGASEVDLITSGGPCKLLNENGCLLDEENRPSLGLLVKPTKVGGPCEKMYASDLVLNWLDYDNVLAQLVRYYTHKDVIDVVVEEITAQMRIIKEKTAQMNIVEEKRQALQSLSPMERANLYWYHGIMADKPYYTPKEVKRMLLTLY